MKHSLLLAGMLFIACAGHCLADYGFAGQSSDASNTCYFRARCYDPDTGTFLTKDPMGISAGDNSYQYVADNPINGVDPLGLFSWWDYTVQTASLIGGAVTTVGGVSATIAGAATSEVGAGVPVAVGGIYLTAQGGAATASSFTNLVYMIQHPNQTTVPLNSSGLAGATVSAVANLAGAKNPSEITSVNEDGSVNYWGIANGAATILDLATTLNVASALPELNTTAQVAKTLPGLAETGQESILARSRILCMKKYGRRSWSQP